MKFGFTVTRGEEEIDLFVEGNFVKGCKGARDGRWGPPIEPDEPPFFEVDSVTDSEGKEFDLTKEEFEEASEYGMRKYQEMICDQYEDCSDRDYEDYLDTL